MLYRLSVALLYLTILTCDPVESIEPVVKNDRQVININPYKQVRYIPLPPGFRRIQIDSLSFADYLSNIALKKSKTVYLFNGQLKTNQSAQYAVLDITVGSRDLQQCADAVMRLRAEYLYAQKKFEYIAFYDNNKTPYRFSAPFTREHFTTYLNRVFGICGTASLSKQLNPVVGIADIQPGDVIICGGFPGHAVIVMDVGGNIARDKVYLLAQSYMPAQDIHVLINPEDKNGSPWFKVTAEPLINTPEFTFHKKELKRW